jgi:Mrp family chromosome partitioning ATPase
VGDALAVSRQADGLLMVVRKDKCDRNSLTAALNKLALVNVKILGMVFNGSETGSTYHA